MADPITKAKLPFNPSMEHIVGVSPWEELYNAVLACKACPLCFESQKPTPFFGNLHSKIAFVGRNPGIQERDMGLPFVGKTLFYIEDLLAYLGLKREQVYVTNIVKCVDGSSFVRTREGVRVLRGINEGDFVLTHSGCFRRVENVIHSNVKSGVEFILHSGRSLKVTLDHKLLTFGESDMEWREASLYKEGDFLSLLNAQSQNSKLVKVPDFSSSGRKDVFIPEEIDEDLAFLMGHLIGDGQCSNSRAVYHYFGLSESSLSDLVCELNIKLFGEAGTRTFKDKKIEICLSSRTVRDMYLNIGLGYWGCREKQVPNFIWESPDTVKWSFLRGLIASDGTSENDAISVSTSSEKLATEIQILFYSLGIRTTLRKFLVDKKFISYRVWVVSGLCIESCRVRMLDFEKGSRIQGRQSSKKGFDLPKSLQEFIFTKNLLIPGRASSSAMSRYRRHGKMTSSVFKFIGGGHSFLNYEYDKITGIKPCEIDCFDLVVEGDHSFVANSVVVHNCYTTTPKPDRPPTPQEIAFCCSQFLAKELAVLQPELIVAFGNDVVQLLTEGVSTVQLNSQFLTCKFGSAKVFVMHHPGYVLRRPTVLGEEWATAAYILRNCLESVGYYGGWGGFVPGVPGGKENGF